MLVSFRSEVLIDGEQILKKCCMEIWSHFLRDDYQCPGNMTICEEPLTNSITTPLRYSCWLENSLSAVKWRYVTNSFQQNRYAREVSHIERRTRPYMFYITPPWLASSYWPTIDKWDWPCFVASCSATCWKEQLQIIQNRCFSYCYFILLAKFTIYDRLCYL